MRTMDVFGECVNEAAVIGPYAIALIRDSIEEFTGRYGFALEEPVVVEMYPDHDANFVGWEL